MRNAGLKDLRERVYGIFFLADFVDRCKGCVEEAPLTKGCVLYSDLLISMRKDNDNRG